MPTAVPAPLTLRRSTSFCILLPLLLSCGGAGNSQAVEVEADTDLAKHTKEFTKEVIEVTAGVHVAVGFGLANSIMIEGDDGLIIVDTMESIEEGEQVLAAFRKISDKPVKALVYTHNHTDHVFGSRAFAGDAQVEVYAHETTAGNIHRVASVVRNIIQVRSARMFGSHLEGSALENAGIGPYLSLSGDSHLEALRPTRTFVDRLETTVAGVKMELVHAPGETEDQLFVWLPDKRVLLCGDNLYRTFPNLYTIRGTAQRDVTHWFESLDLMRAKKAAFLVPSHTRPLKGDKKIHETLTVYRDAIQFVHDQTVFWMNRGLTPDEIVEKVKLPAHLAGSPFLAEFYGTVRWSVRSIFGGYMGWFDGNPTTLDPTSPGKHARHLAELAGGANALRVAAKKAVAAGDHGWALELTDALLLLSPDDAGARALRVKALTSLGEAESNPNGRHYYLTAAKELRDDFRAGVAPTPTPAMVHSLPLAMIFRGLATRLDLSKAADVRQKVNFVFPDKQVTWSVWMRRGVAEVQPVALPDAQLTLTVDSHVWKEIAAKLRNPAAAFLSGEIAIDGSKADMLRFLGYFDRT